MPRLLARSPVMVAVFCYASYALAGNVLTTAEAYTALALFNLLRFPLAFLPFLITMIVNAMVGRAAARQLPPAPCLPSLAST